ncbi:MAG: hypothetical protein ACRC8S_08935 [Fimbriiglobus sp.]
MLRCLSWFAVLLVAGQATPLFAQVKYPVRAEKYSIDLRYRIQADRDERIRQYRAMKLHLKNLGFEETVREDGDLDIFDSTAEMLSGTIPSANVTKLFEDSHIKTVVARPTEMMLPEDGKKLVAVRLRLPSGFAAAEQQKLHEQTSQHLGLMAFQEEVGYDHKGFTWLRGKLPFENASQLTKDLRNLPAGWFTSAVPLDQQPLPFRNTLPLRFVELIADPEQVAEMAPLPAEAPCSPKFAPDVKAIFLDPANAGKPQRVDVILEQTPGDDWANFRTRVRTCAEGVSVEGLVGLVMTARVSKTEDLTKLAELLEVKAVRLPRMASETASISVGASKTSPAEALAASRVAELHRLGHRGLGAKVVLIGTDFGGLPAAIGTDLPARTKFVDLTAELSKELTALPLGEKLGAGTMAAKIAQATAPDASLTIVRIDRSAFFQLVGLAKAIRGDIAYSEAFQTRAFELNRLAETLTANRTAIVTEYTRAFSNLSDEEKPTARRDAAKKALDQLLADEEAFKKTIDRFNKIRDGIESLGGATLVINTVTFDTGYPQDGLNELSRYLDERYVATPSRSAIKAAKEPALPVWVQAAGVRASQIWAGPFLDVDGNKVLEFSPASVPMPQDRWTRELNFLGYQPVAGNPTPTLPTGAKLRFTIQWREPQDPDGYVPREPVFPMTLRLLRQIDPEGKTAATDELVEVARSTGNPIKLLRTTASGAFEQTLEVTIPKDGVYALRVEGRSAFEYQIPALRQQVEVSPRIVVESVDPTKGSPEFRTFTSIRAGVGTPGDAAAVVTIGIKGTTTQQGIGPGVALSTKPDMLTFGAISIGNDTLTGTAASAAFFGGSAACLNSAGVRGIDLVRTVGINAGSEFILPADWLRTLPGVGGRR